MSVAAAAKFRPRKGPPLPAPELVFAEVVRGQHSTLGAAVAELAPSAGCRDRAIVIRTTIRAVAARGMVDDDLAALLAKIASPGSDETIVTAAGQLVCARLHDRARLGVSA